MLRSALRRPYRRTPKPPGYLRIVQDDRVPLPLRLEREVLVRELARKVTFAVLLVAIGGMGAVLAVGVAATLRWIGK